MKKLLVYLLIFFSLASESQNIKYARSIISDLCSPKFAGRGYTNGSDEKTAKYIGKELKRTYLSVTYQPFKINTNTLKVPIIFILFVFLFFKKVIIMRLLFFCF